MAILIGVLLGICALAFVLTPLVQHPSRDGERGDVEGGPLWSSVKDISTKAEHQHVSLTDNTAQTTEHEQSARTALQEIELDYRLGNISEADYTLLRERYMRRALVAMKSRYEREQELDTTIEEQLHHMKQQEEQSDEG